MINKTMQFRELQFEIKPDVETRTFTLPVSSELPVERWWGTEILDHSPESIRMDRLNNGAPVLLDHDATKQIGVVEEARVIDRRLEATIRFSRSALGQEVFDDVIDGIRKNVSIGYRIDSLKETGKDQYRVDAWQPLEITLTSIPADNSVGFGRSEKSDFNPLELLNNRSESMTDQTVTETPAEKSTPVAETSPADTALIESRAVERERVRSAAIREAVRIAKLGEEEADRLIQEGRSLADAKEEIMRKWSSRIDETTRDAVRVEHGADQLDKFKSGAAAAIEYRMGMGEDDRSNEFRGQSLGQLAARSLELSGVRTVGLSRNEIAGLTLRAHSTSDFPYLLADAANKSLQRAYSVFPSIWRQISTVGSVSDFKTINLIRLGSFSSLATIPEGSEYTAGTVAESREQLTPATKGRYIQLTRQMIINDDLSGFSRLSSMLGQAAARTVNADVLGILTANAALSDGTALFHADHANLAGSGAAISVATLSAARAAMRKQQDPSGLDYLNIQPRYLVVPVGTEDAAREVISSAYNTDTTAQLKKNPISGWSPLEVLSDPLLDANSATAWYLIADPMMAPLLEIHFLDGQQAPYVASEEEFLTDAIRWKVRLDYGVGANDFRGGYKNAGA